MSETFTIAEYKRRMDFLDGLVANIRHGSDDIRHPARLRVEYYCAHFPEELPAWFEIHHRELLICMVEEAEEEPDEDDGPRCRHGLANPYTNCVACSAEMSGGSDWRRCHHGYYKGECPTCHPGGGTTYEYH